MEQSIIQYNSHPLTIDEIKYLEKGDWIWVVDKFEVTKANKGTYEKITDKNNYTISLNGINGFALYRYDTYGEVWIAYKNKEQVDPKEWEAFVSTY